MSSDFLSHQKGLLFLFDLRANTINTPEPIHPSEFLEKLDISQYRLAKTIGVPPIRINAIIKRCRSITVDTAPRIGRALGTTPDFWLNLQRMYDPDLARITTKLWQPFATPPQ